jgi:hypothetical protein
MTAYSVFEVCVVSLVVLFCVYRAFSKMMPKTRAKVQNRAAAWLAAPGHPAWMASMGGRWKQTEGGGGCGSGCDSCGTCGPSTPAKPDEPKSVKLVRREQV